MVVWPKPKEPHEFERFLEFDRPEPMVVRPKPKELREFEQVLQFDRPEPMVVRPKPMVQFFASLHGTMSRVGTKRDHPRYTGVS